jgi:superfamily II DNA or RNA helicase
MMHLFRYQIKTIEALRASIAKGFKRLLLCSPTGSGKTFIFSFIALEHLKKGGSVLIITDRVELLKQTHKGLSEAEIISANSTPDLSKSLHIGMVETISRRVNTYADFIKSKSLIIIDEAHKKTFEKLYNFFSEDAIVIGATATPIPTQKPYYEDIIQEIDTPELISLGYLATANTYGIEIDLKGVKKKGGDYDPTQMGDLYSKKKIYKGVLENYKRICPGTKTILFASNINSSKEICSEFTSEGFDAKHLDSTMGVKEREEVIKWFTESNSSQILCNVGILTTGFDCKDIETVILYRATTSLPLFLQMVGRGSRVTETKRQFNILDFGNNILTHNFWEYPRLWSLNEKEKTKKVPVIKICKRCNAMIPASLKACSYCGFEIPVSKKEKEEKEIAELKLLSKKEALNLANISDIKTKVLLSKAKVINPFWVIHNLKRFEDAELFINLMGYKKGFIEKNKNRFEVFRGVHTVAMLYLALEYIPRF